jgi:lipoate-protein ligase B
MDHVEAERLQERLVDARRAGEAPDTLLFVEHDPVVTVGRGVEDLHAEISAQLLESAGAQIRQVSRGGRATFHGPGQIVGYPILDLRQHRRDLHWYLRSLEQVIIDALAEFEFDARRRDGLTGVWIGERKVASIGIAVRGWVSWHGFALNVDVEPRWWRMIDPCGLRPEEMASLSEIGPLPPAGEIRGALARSLCEVFGLKPLELASTELFAGPAF